EGDRLRVERARDRRLAERLIARLRDVLAHEPRVEVERRSDVARQRLPQGVGPRPADVDLLPATPEAPQHLPEGGDAAFDASERRRLLLGLLERSEEHTSE